MINYYLPVDNIIRPDRLATPESEKDEKYHIEMVNWAAFSGASCQAYMEDMKQIDINKKFVSGKQWILDEDAIVFLKDEDNQDTGRIRTNFDYLQQMNNIYKSYASQIDFTARAQSFSPFVQERKNEMMYKMLFYTMIAQDNPQLRNKLKRDLPIGDDAEETKALFEDYYKDKFVEQCNNLLEYFENLNGLPKMQPEFAEDMFYSGMCIARPHNRSGEWLIDRILPERFFFDRTAVRYDLSDCNYGGEMNFMMPTDIYEAYPNVSDANKEKIEYIMRMQSDVTYVNTPTYNRSGKVPVLIGYWRDGTRDKFGYVKDQFNQNVLRRLNYQIKEGDKVYTESDCVPNSELTPYQRGILKLKPNDKKKNTAEIYLDQWRYCKYIPVVWTGISKEKDKFEFKNKKKLADRSDIVLEYGIVEYGEKDLRSPSHMKFPYKVGMHIYIDGHVIAPASILINPQRMINRIMSVLENQINHSGLSGPIIDESAFDNADAALSAMKRGEPLKARANGMPIQNIVAQYNSLPNRQTSDLVNYANVFKEATQEMSGMKDIMGKVPADKLVGVMQMQAQQGNLIREPFFNALSNMYEQLYQSCLTSGRRLYIDNDKQLIHIIGDEINTFKLSEDSKWEDFRVKLRRVDNLKQERAEVDQLIISYANPQVNYLDDIRAANLLHRASYDDLSKAIRDYAKEKRQLKKMQAQKQEQMMAQEMEKQAKEKELALRIKQQDDQREVDENEKDRLASFDKALLQSHTKRAVKEMDIAAKEKKE